MTATLTKEEREHELSKLRKSQKAATVGCVMELTEAVADEAIKAIKATRARIEELEKRLAEIETKGIEYHGVWQRASGYQRGAMTTHQGSLWACVTDTSHGSEPGKSKDWQLAAKGTRG